MAQQIKKIFNILYGAEGGGVDTVTNQYVKFKNDKFVSQLKIIKKEKGNIFKIINLWIKFFDNIIKENPRMVICHGHQPNFIFSIYKKIFFYKDLKKIIFISVFHSEYFGYPNAYSFKASLFNYIYGFFLKFSDEVITVSNYSKKTLFEKHSIQAKVILNPIPESFFYKNKSKIKKKYNKVSLIAVSRFDPIKRNFFLIDIIKNLRLKIPDINLKIIGGGYQFDIIKNYIKQEKLEKNIKLLGWQDNVAKYLDNSKFYISTSSIENLSISLMEAMSRNCIPIINKVGGNPEVVINNKNGYIFKMNRLNTTTSLIYKILYKKNIDQNKIKDSINKKFSPKKFHNALGKYINKINLNYE